MSPDSRFDSLELHIEELVLHGFPQTSQAEIARHIQQELTSLLQQGGLPPGLESGASVSRLDGGSFNAPPDATPQALGAQVARSLYQGLGR